MTEKANDAEINALKTRLAASQERHPVQPLYKDAAGVVRFKPNRIVDKLLDVARAHGYGLNEIAEDDFDRDDRVQFAQLIGYSLCGFGDLSYVSDDDYRRARANDL